MALEALGEELAREGVRGQVFVVGGAAMALAYTTRRATKDIDAVFEPKMLVYEAAAPVAERVGRPDNWLNDGVKGFLPGPEDDRVPPPEVEGIEATTASARYTLAMRLLAMRFGEDDEDIEVLLRLTPITAVEEALALLKAAYPHREPAVKTRLFLEEVLGR